MNDVQISGLENVVDNIYREKSKILLRSGSGDRVEERHEFV